MFVDDEPAQESFRRAREMTRHMELTGEFYRFISKTLSPEDVNSGLISPPAHH